MLTNDELDLARAKAIAWANSPSPSTVDAVWAWLRPATQRKWLRAAKALRVSDDTMGVVSVPVKATDEMKEAGDKAASFYGSERVWSVMLGASPLREKPDDR